MRTRRYRNKTKNNRKRGGAADLLRRATEATRRVYNKYFKCCRPEPQPQDGDGVAAAAAVGVGPALPPPGSRPFIRRASPGSRGASCVPCPPSSSRSPSRPLPAIPSPSRFASPVASDVIPPVTSDRTQSHRASRLGTRRLSPAAAVASGARLVSYNPSHFRVIQSCIEYWQLRTDDKRETLRVLLDSFERTARFVEGDADRREKRRKMFNNDIERIISETKVTANEFLRARASLIFWTDVSQGTARGPLLSMMTTDTYDGTLQAVSYLPRQYVSRLQAETAALPDRVDPSNLAVFRSLL